MIPKKVLSHTLLAILRLEGRYRRAIIVLVHMILFVLSNYLAFFIRFEGNIPSNTIRIFLMGLPFLIILRFLSFYLLGLFRGLWRYTSTYDVKRLIEAILASTLGFYLVMTIFKWQFYPISIYIIDGLVLLCVTGGLRFLRRLTKDWYQDVYQGEKRKLLIIGAGDAGEMILRDIKGKPHIHFQVIGFLDDDPKKKKATLHGIPVLGTVDDIGDVVKRYPIDEILIAIPSASGKQMRRIIEKCRTTGLKYLTIPGIGELIDGKASINHLREVRIDDLLGRKPIRLDLENIRQEIEGKGIMITGAGGSIGSELVRQVCCFKPSSLILYEMAENFLYQIDLEVRKRHPHLNIIPIIGDIRNKIKVERVLSLFRPHLIYHAAAYKHVPMMEMNPLEAIKSNVFGTLNLVDACENFGVEKFVFISTDKAVNPTSIMGATKRIAENVLQCFNHNKSNTRFVSVRFGNVLGSNGSVIPLFKRQIEEGGPITVTHPEIIRYFMAIPEAVQLVIQAGAMGKGGEIFVLDMGEPIKIVDLAKDLIRLSGVDPDLIDIEYIGLRPGEKLYEELMTDGEDILPTFHEKIKIFKSHVPDSVKFMNKLKELEYATFNYKIEMVLPLIRELVPEYRCSNWMEENRKLGIDSKDVRVI